LSLYLLRKIKLDKNMDIIKTDMARVFFKKRVNITKYSQGSQLRKRICGKSFQLTHQPY